VNGERTYQPIELQDGDRIRLGSMTFDFWVNYTCNVLPTVAMELLMQLMHRQSNTHAEILTFSHHRQKPLIEKPNENLEILKNSELVDKLEHCYDNFSSEQKSEILDRFFSRQEHCNPT
jgi:pSer/pThr/pTyr-binding forkhead associated (FHA) protein